MIKFHSIHLSNFMSFESATLNYADSGLILVQGDNLDSVYADSNFCLVGDTLIDCPRDLYKYPRGIPIRKLVGKEFWTYVWKNGSLSLAKCKRVWKTKRRARVVKVKLTKYGKAGRKSESHLTTYMPTLELIGTKDHLVLLSDGKTWKELGKLERGDSLCSMYRRTDWSRTAIRWTGNEKGMNEPRFIAEKIYGKRDGFHARHKNERGLDNTPENIQYMSESKHKNYHAQKRNLNETSGWKVTGVHPRGMLGKAQSKNSVERGKKISFGHELNKKIKINHTVTSVEDFGYGAVYDMCVPGAENFIANGVVVHNSGKSNLAVEALLWCLYEQGMKEKGPDGHTVDQYRKDDVVLHDEDLCELELHFSVDNVYHVVKRSKKRNGVSDLSVTVNNHTLKGKSKADTQEKLNRILGMSYSTASQVIVFGQNTRRFTQAKDSERKKIFEELLGLHVFGDALKEIRDRKKELKSDIQKIEMDLKGVETSSEQWRQWRNEAIRDYLDSVKHVKGRKADMNKKKLKVLESVKETRGTIAQRKGEVENLTKNIIKMEARARGKLNEEILKKKQAVLDKKLKPLDVRHEILVQREETIEDFHISTCPTCEQKLDKGHVKKLIKETRAEMENIEKQVKGLIAKRSPISMALIERGSLMNEIARTRAKLDIHKEQVKTNKGILKGQLQRVKDLDLFVPPKTKADKSKMDKARKKLEAAKLEVKKTRKKLDALNKEMDDFEFWETGFGNRGIKSLMLDSVLPILNSEANKYINLLMDDVEIELDTETTIKSGELRDIFEVRICSGKSHGYHLASGGERRRIDFCISLALQSLLASTGSRCNIFILDEPFESVDESGIGELVDLLREYSKKQKVAVYCISHLSNLKPLFDDVVTVQRKNGISAIA